MVNFLGRVDGWTGSNGCLDAKRKGRVAQKRQRRHQSETSAFCPTEILRLVRSNGRNGARPCENTIVTNHWEIYCYCAHLRHCEDFRYTISRAIGLLAFVSGLIFHTASGMRRRSTDGS